MHSVRKRIVIRCGKEWVKMMKNEIVKQQKKIARKTCKIFPSYYSSLFESKHFFFILLRKICISSYKEIKLRSKRGALPRFLYFDFFYIIILFYCNFNFFLCLSYKKKIHWLKWIKFEQEKIKIDKKRNNIKLYYYKDKDKDEDDEE